MTRSRYYNYRDQWGEWALGTYDDGESLARKYGFIVPLDGAPDVFLHLRDLDPGVAEALEELAVVSYDVVPYRDKTKAVRLQIVDAAAYAQLVLENQGRTLSVRDAAVELGRLRAIPLPPRAGEDPTRV